MIYMGSPCWHTDGYGSAMVYLIFAPRMVLLQPTRSPFAVTYSAKSIAVNIKFWRLAWTVAVLDGMGPIVSENGETLAGEAQENKRRKAAGE